MKAATVKTTKQTPALLKRDLKTLVIFIEVYCKGNHKVVEKAVLNLKTHDLKALMGHEVKLCPDCSKLLTHALVKRTACPMDPKPMCKHCPNHCYHPTYRQQIQDVMRYSGKKIMMHGRIDYLIHLLF